MPYLLEAWDGESGDSNREVVGEPEEVTYRVERLPEGVTLSVARINVSEGVLPEPEAEPEEPTEPETETVE